MFKILRRSQYREMLDKVEGLRQEYRELRDSFRILEGEKKDLGDRYENDTSDLKKQLGVLQQTAQDFELLQQRIS